MSKVAIVTDSTTTIPPEMLRALPVHSLPLQVIWNEQVYLDGVDMTPAEFYTRIQTDPDMPTTSQVTPAAFKQLYARLLEEGYDILSIHLSSKLSGTLDSAIQAKTSFPGAQIEMFDSLSTSMALGFQVLAVARAATQGATLKECVALAGQAREKTGVFFVLNTLEFLRRGGRIGGAAAFLGTALNLKPILQLQDGRIEAVERVRTMTKAVDRMVENFRGNVNGHRPIRLAAVHANAPEEAARLLDQVRQHYGISEVTDAIIAPISPVLGTHTGPGCLGLAYMIGM